MKVQRAIVVTLTLAWVRALGCWRHTLKFYVRVFLCYGQGNVRQAFLYGDMSLFDTLKVIRGLRCSFSNQGFS